MRSKERIIKALANRRRLMIVSLLKRRSSVSVGEFAGVLKVTLPTASKHLAILSSVDIVDYERKSLQVYYHLSKDIPAIASSILKHI